MQPRGVTCEGCGAAFECGRGGACWCAGEPFRLPIPDPDTADCLCPRCLCAKARDQATRDHAAVTNRS